jgi:iron complex outermembrane receptor protein
VRLPTALLPAAAGTVALSCLVAGVAAAADSASGSGDLLEIVVTAEKVSESASKTPLSLTVVTPQELALQGVNSIDTLTSVPSLAVTNGGHGPLLTIRGVTTTDPSSKGTVAVLFNQDGIAIGRPEVTQVAMFDVERVEVLRGPQGTLYGESSTGGAINVISARPINTFDASASVDFGNYNTRREQAMINLPLTDTLMIRLAGASNYREGYLNPVLYYPTNSPPATLAGTQAALDAEDNTNGRLSVLWNFSDAGSLLFHATAGHLGGTGDVSGSALLDRYNDGNAYAQQVYYNPLAGGVDDHYQKYDAELNLDMGPVHLAYVGGWLKYAGVDNYEPSTGLPDGTTPTYGFNDYKSDNTYNSHELRLSNAHPQRLEYVVGANFWKEDTNEVDNNWNTYVFAEPQLGCNFPAPNTQPFCSTPQPNIVALNQHETKGVFGQTTFHVTDDFKIAGGMRYSSDSMFRHGSIAVGPGPLANGAWPDASGNPCHPGDPCVPLSNGATGTPIQNDVGSESSSKVTWRVEADYQVAHDQMIYGYVATGYKGGSFNDVCPSNGNLPCKYGPENMIAYELGYKGKITPTFEVVSDIYYYDYSKFQLTVPTFLTQAANGGSPAVIIYTKLVPVKLYGWEGELHWNLTQDDLFSMTATVENGYYGPGTTVGFDGAIPYPWVGKRVDNLPPFATTASFEHRFHLSQGGFISARILEKFSGGYYESNLGGDVIGGPPFLAFPGEHYDLPPQQYYNKPFTQTNLNLDYTSDNGKFVVDAYVRNLENKMQLAGAPPNAQPSDNLPAGYGPDSVTVPVTPPRTFGIRFSWKY